MNELKQIWAVFLKEVKSEYRTKYSSISAIFFVITTISIIVFGFVGESMTPTIASALLWLVLFFTSLPSIQRSFVNEFERGSFLLLSLSASLLAIYLGKLLYNILLTVILFALSTFVFLVFFDEIAIVSYKIYFAFLFLASIGIATSLTFISAIITKASAKGAVYPVLAFPILLPLLISGIESTYLSLTTFDFSDAVPALQIMFGYCGALIAISYILFDFIFKD